MHYVTKQHEGQASFTLSYLPSYLTRFQNMKKKKQSRFIILYTFWQTYLKIQELRNAIYWPEEMGFQLASAKYDNSKPAGAMLSCIHCPALQMLYWASSRKPIVWISFTKYVVWMGIYLIRGVVYQISDNATTPMHDESGLQCPTIPTLFSILPKSRLSCSTLMHGFPGW